LRIQQSSSEKICVVINYVNLLGLHDFAKLSEDQRYISQIFLTAYNTI